MIALLHYNTELAFHRSVDLSKSQKFGIQGLIETSPLDGVTGGATIDSIDHFLEISNSYDSLVIVV